MHYTCLYCSALLRPFSTSTKVPVRCHSAWCCGLTIKPNPNPNWQALTEDRLTYAAAFDVKLHPLPSMLFANGHVAFIQRNPFRNGAEPYAIHATFQRYNLEGKRSRLRCASQIAILIVMFKLNFSSLRSGRC